MISGNLTFPATFACGERWHAMCVYGLGDRLWDNLAILRLHACPHTHTYTYLPSCIPGNNAHLLLLLPPQLRPLGSALRATPHASMATRRAPPRRRRHRASSRPGSAWVGRLGDAAYVAQQLCSSTFTTRFCQDTFDCSTPCGCLFRPCAGRLPRRQRWHRGFNRLHGEPNCIPWLLSALCRVAAPATTMASRRASLFRWAAVPQLWRSPSRCVQKLHVPCKRLHADAATLLCWRSPCCVALRSSHCVAVGAPGGKWRAGQAGLRSLDCLLCNPGL